MQYNRENTAFSTIVIFGTTGHSCTNNKSRHKFYTLYKNVKIDHRTKCKI